MIEVVWRARARFNWAPGPKVDSRRLAAPTIGHAPGSLAEGCVSESLAPGEMLVFMGANAPISAPLSPYLVTDFSIHERRAGPEMGAAGGSRFKAETN